MDSEEELVDRITKAVPSIIPAMPAKSGPRNQILSLGVGDDSALFSLIGKAEWAITCDAFLEGVHFFANRHPPDSVGYKSLVRATSDLAAMGATPRFFLMTLALPASRTGTWLDGFLRGMGRAARELKMCVAGGDTSRFPAVSISITVLGEVPRGAAVTRSGARPGDQIYVSGKLGRAQLGLELFRNGFGKGKRYAALLRPHLYPAIRIELGSWLAKNRVASAMMDVSDGLSLDLRRLCKSSGVGALLDGYSIPCVDIPAKIRRLLPKTRLDPLQMALGGGDDYELLFTVPPKNVERLRRAPGASELAAIGEVARARDLLIVSPNGRKQRLDSLGWDPFRKK